jgi:Delta-aminolevulinic acid dehydratase
MSAEFPVVRPRRLRRTTAMRRLVAETRLNPADLVLPMFVKEGISEAQPVSSMPGVVQHTSETLRKAAHEAVEAGVGGLILFGIPAAKDGRGSAADDPDGIVQKALRDLSADLGDSIVIMSDLCLDEYTDHGHCGLLTPAGEVDNDATLEALRLDCDRPGGRGSRRGGAQRHDGRPGAGHSDGPRPGRLQRSGDHGLLRQIRLRLLRPLPGGRRVRPAVR